MLCPNILYWISRLLLFELWCFLCFKPERAVENAFELVIWDAMTLIWVLCRADTVYLLGNTHDNLPYHDDVFKWKHFPRYWPFVRGLDRWAVNSPHKSQWRGALIFSLICAWINGWLNKRDAGDLRRHYVHYDVTVMYAELSVIWGATMAPMWHCCTFSIPSTYTHTHTHIHTHLLSYFVVVQRWIISE